MPTDNIEIVQRRVIEAMTGGEQLKKLLEGEYGNVKEWALSERIDPVEIYHVLAGRRRGPAYERHRDAIARATRLSRETVNWMLDSPKEAVSAA